jgi:gas vesicle protein
MTKILVAFLAGLGLGLLLAPEEGKELREKIGDWFNDAVDTGRDAVRNGVSRGQDAVDDLESRLRNAIK